MERYVHHQWSDKRLIKGRILKQYINKHGYLHVKLSIKGKTK